MKHELEELVKVKQYGVLQNKLNGVQIEE